MRIDGVVSVLGRHRSASQEEKNWSVGNYINGEGEGHAEDTTKLDDDDDDDVYTSVERFSATQCYVLLVMSLTLVNYTD